MGDSKLKCDAEYFCQACARLKELAPPPLEGARYWAWTELFVALHGADECTEETRARADALFDRVADDGKQ